jgi:DNA topoisomerase VI subunit A
MPASQFNVIPATSTLFAGNLTYTDEQDEDVSVSGGKETQVPYNYKNIRSTAKVIIAVEQVSMMKKMLEDRFWSENAIIYGLMGNPDLLTR